MRSLLLRILLASWLAACALGMAGAAPAWLYASESLDQAGSIVGTDTDSVDGEANQHSFDAALWKAEPKQRASMVEDLRRSLEGRSVDDLRSLLGPEDGAEDLQPHYWGTPFELTVHCSIGVLNWDEFVYWPLEEYPDHMMGVGSSASAAGPTSTSRAAPRAPFLGAHEACNPARSPARGNAIVG